MPSVGNVAQSDSIVPAAFGLVEDVLLLMSRMRWRIGLELLMSNLAVLEELEEGAAVSRRVGVVQACSLGVEMSCGSDERQHCNFCIFTFLGVDVQDEREGFASLGGAGVFGKERVGRRAGYVFDVVGVARRSGGCFCFLAFRDPIGKVG